MKIIILLCAALFLASANIVQIVEGASRPNDVKGVVECIVEKYNNINDVSAFCGAEIDANAGCYSNYYSLNLCLINNLCFFKTGDITITTACWNCWKDVPYSSDKFVQLQKDIAGCYEPFFRAIGLLLVALLVLL